MREFMFDCSDPVSLPPWFSVSLHVNSYTCTVLTLSADAQTSSLLVGIASAETSGMPGVHQSQIFWLLKTHIAVFSEILPVSLATAFGSTRTWQLGIMTFVGLSRVPTKTTMTSSKLWHVTPFRSLQNYAQRWVTKNLGDIWQNAVSLTEYVHWRPWNIHCTPQSIYSPIQFIFM